MYISWRIAGAGGNKKARIKVKRFKPEWLAQTIGGRKASLWLKPQVMDSGRGFAPCVRPAERDFSHMNVMVMVRRTRRAATAQGRIC